MPARRIFLLLLLCATSFAQRLPVLKQIDLPHPYYFREMYLPQLTTGPSAACWLPDSSTLIYSMAGSLWRQALSGARAKRLTAGPGYDYQPDCSPDGNWVIYDKYDKDAVELWALDLRTGTSHALTSNAAVNVEPRFSPDGKRIAFVSTSFHGHFHIFTADFSSGLLANLQQLTEEHKSDLPRYYYSAYDHEISPVWSRDGKEILFISNRGHLYGTGGLWRMKAEAGADMHEIHSEETTWKARPDFSPDGHRIVYASYTGRQSHQLWTLDAAGENPIPLTYGDFDNINPRWSPDGSKIAYITNLSANTALVFVDVPGGAVHAISTGGESDLPFGILQVNLEDETGAPVSARISIQGSDGRDYAPTDSSMHADDSFDRSQRAFEQHYFHHKGRFVVRLPAGATRIQVTHGLAYKIEQRSVNISAAQPVELTIQLHHLDLPREFIDHNMAQWLSGDVHVHMNYAGTYYLTPWHLQRQVEAEDLDFLEDLIVNKEQRIPDIRYFSPGQYAIPRNGPIFHTQEYHTSYWGHLGLLHLTHNFILPGYAGYSQTAMASIVPMNADIADLAHAQGGLVGYAHPFDTYPDPAHDAALTDELPVDVALGKVDYLEVVGFSDHKSTAAVWYHLLNCGFHLPAAGGTDAMANFASLRGPVGLNRTYAQVPRPAKDVHGKPDHDAFLAALKRGNTFATNGPLLGFTLNGKGPGDELQLNGADTTTKGTTSVVARKPRKNNRGVPHVSPPLRDVGITNLGTAQLHIWLRSIVAVDHLEFVCNGRVVQTLKLAEANTSADSDTTIRITQSGWCLLRAYADSAREPVLDIYPYATTSPVYVTVPSAPLQSKDDTAYFLAWINRLQDAAEKFPDYNTDAEKQHVLNLLGKARTIYADKGR